MPGIRMLPEGLAMVRRHDHHRLVEQPAGVESLEEPTERAVAFVKGVPICRELVVSLERAWLDRRVGMVTCGREIRHKEGLPVLTAVDPGEHSIHGRRVVDAKARLDVTANDPCVLESVEPHAGDQIVHPQVGEAP